MPESYRKVETSGCQDSECRILDLKEISYLLLNFFMFQMMKLKSRWDPLSARGRFEAEGSVFQLQSLNLVHMNHHSTPLPLGSL
jgi:hypothetical protein